MKVIVEILDKDADFGIKVLRSLAFIKKALPMSQEAIRVKNDLEKAARQVKEHKAGKLHLKTAQEVLDEL